MLTLRDSAHVELSLANAIGSARHGNGMAGVVARSSMRRVREDGTEVVVRCQEDPGVFVRLTDCHPLDEYRLAFRVEVQAEGLCARTDTVVAEWYDDLTHFVEGLAADFRGWEGARVWQANRVELSAVFRSRGHVCLKWTLRGATLADAWEVSIETWQEAGEQMKALAADIRDFLHRPPA
ncbi:DUF6228 family protein [Kibdelosporangium persicum]|uniref:DUF6228 family protein n=1 Tax=Kibdelosporangium persicum TaxID=2698649 RepID=UPI001C25B196|nr:DUF6228 family protein [Kibdelosporangium persicum]